MDDFTYDVAISFAEEDLNIALCFYLALKKYFLADRIFYYKDNFTQTGRSLDESLVDVYGKQSRFVLMLVSENYIRPTKKYAQLEAKVIVNRWHKEKDTTFFIPVLINRTALTKVDDCLKQVSRIKWDHDPEKLAKKLNEMWGKPTLQAKQIADNISYLPVQAPTSFWARFIAVFIALILYTAACFATFNTLFRVNKDYALEINVLNAHKINDGDLSVLTVYIDNGLIIQEDISTQGRGLSIPLKNYQEGDTILLDVYFKEQFKHWQDTVILDHQSGISLALECDVQFAYQWYKKLLEDIQYDIKFNKHLGIATLLKQLETIQESLIADKSLFQCITPPLLQDLIQQCNNLNTQINHL